MAKRRTFTGEEWALLRLAPALVSGGAGAADPSGLFASINEATAGAQGTARAYRRNGRLKLFSALAADCSVPGVPDPKTLLGDGSCEQQMRNFKTAALERVKAAVDLVARKGSPAEARAYRRMILAMAENVANGSKARAFIADVQRAAGTVCTVARDQGQEVDLPQRLFVDALPSDTGRSAHACNPRPIGFRALVRPPCWGGAPR